MKIRYLLDEHLSPRLKAAVKRRDPTVDILRVGDEGAPPLGTLDPDILRYLEQSGRALITKNRASMEGAYTSAPFKWRTLQWNFSRPPENAAGPLDGRTVFAVGCQRSKRVERPIAMAAIVRRYRGMSRRPATRLTRASSKSPYAISFGKRIG